MLKPSTITVLTQIRNEGPRLKEWIEYHYNCYDIDLFYFYLDKPTDDSKKILKELSKKFPIKYKPTDGIGLYNGNDSMHPDATQRQLRSLKKGFNFLKYKFDWIAIIDVDEWIVPNNLQNYNLKQTLKSYNRNLFWLPSYFFKPPFDANKSIVSQNFYRCSSEERSKSKYADEGKSIVRGKIGLDEVYKVDVHRGPEANLYNDEIDFWTDNADFRIHHFQSHCSKSNLDYGVFDNSIAKIIKQGYNN